MANIVNQYGQVKVGVRTQLTPPPSSLWTNVYSVYNADATGSSSLKTSLFAAYNGESNTNDSFGSNNGTAVGGLTYGTGKIGNAFQFNGSNSAINLSTNSMNLTGDFSISAWVNLSNNYSGVNEVTLLMNLNVTSWFANPKGIHLNINNNNLNFNLFADTNTNSLFWNDSTGSIIKANSGWIHVVATRKSATGSKLYVNGVLKASNTNTIDSTYHTSFQVPTIGRRFVYDRTGNLVNNSMYAPDGTKIDAVNIWQKELTQSEITELYNSGNGAQYITDNFYKPTPNDALNTNNGTAQGGLTYGVGKVGTAFQFNGTNAYINLPTNSLQLTTFSMNFWVFNPSTQSTTIAANFGNDGQNKGWYIDLSNLSSHTIRFVGFNNNINTIALSAAGGIGFLNRWSMATITVNGTSVKMYLDGSLVSSGTMSNTINYTTTTYPLIGGYRVNNGGVSSILANNTRLDAFNVWNKALTTSEITELYNSGNGKQYTI